MPIEESRHAFIPRERSQSMPAPGRNVGSKFSHYKHPNLPVLQVFETDVNPLSAKLDHQMDEDRDTSGQCGNGQYQWLVQKVQR